MDAEGGTATGVPECRQPQPVQGAATVWVLTHAGSHQAGGTMREPGGNEQAASTATSPRSGPSKLRTSPHWKHRSSALEKNRLPPGLEVSSFRRSCAPVAQLDRAADYGSAGLRFDSSRVHQFFSPPAGAAYHSFRTQVSTEPFPFTSIGPRASNPLSGGRFSNTERGTWIASGIPNDSIRLARFTVSPQTS